METSKDINQCTLAAAGDEQQQPSSSSANDEKIPKNESHDDESAKIPEGKEESATSTSTTPSTNNNKRTSDEDPETKPLSKNQLRKRKKMAYVAEKKAKRKLQDKEVKRQKALAEGRDLDKERKEQEENTKKGEGHKRREEAWSNRMRTTENSFGVCIDCSYEDKMTPKEINSLSQQIRYCYSNNRKNDNPCNLSVSSLSGDTLGHLNKVCGFPEQWATRAFLCSSKSILDMHPDKSKLVYLTSDSDNTLNHLDNGKIYIIGGIVDRNRLKRAAISNAESIGLATAKLPISDYFNLVTTKVLTCNHVFEILLKYRECGNDWKKTMLAVLPARKGVETVSSPVPEDGETFKNTASEEEQR